MMRQIQQQRAQQGGGGAPGGGGFVPAGATRDPATGLIKFGGYDPLSGGRPGQYGSEGDPSQPGYDDRSYEDFAAQQRQQGPGITDEVIRSRYGDRNANQGAIFTSGMGGPGRVGEVSAGGGMYTDPNHPNYSPPGSGGSFDMSGKYTPPTRGPLTGVDPTGGRPWGGGGGKPRPGPGMMPPGSGGDEGGGGIPGGPRVPPNMRGYLQKQRMMNRAPANVGGGANRVGMQDQQGALSRAMQRGTGRAPPSRRFGSGRAGAGRGFQQP
jgi:hypothetical protein